MAPPRRRPILGSCIGAWAALANASGCSRAAPDAQPVRTAETPGFTSAPADAAEAARPEAQDDAPALRPPVAVDGPHRRLLDEGRPIYFAFPATDGGAPPGDAGPLRLVAHLHGTCGGPEYACGSWLQAAVEVGALVCPTGNAHCGPSPQSPPTWEAPSWTELVREMDASLEKSVSVVQRHAPRAVGREGAILTGYSRGGYAVPFIATLHPGRWPLLLVIEADATLDPIALRHARVKAVALVAGEWGDQIAGMRKTLDLLAASSFPARLFVMPKTAHLYSKDVDDVMRDALSFLVASEGRTLP